MEEGEKKLAEVVGSNPTRSISSAYKKAFLCEKREKGFSSPVIGYY
jgi:hypothetical protein